MFLRLCFFLRCAAHTGAMTAPIKAVTDHIVPAIDHIVPEIAHMEAIEVCTEAETAHTASATDDTEVVTT